jgi:hypothetical protein
MNSLGSKYCHAALKEGIKGSLVEALLPRQQIRDGELDMATSRGKILTLASEKAVFILPPTTNLSLNRLKIRTRKFSPCVFGTGEHKSGTTQIGGSVALSAECGSRRDKATQDRSLLDALGVVSKHAGTRCWKTSTSASHPNVGKALSPSDG